MRTLKAFLVGILIGAVAASTSMHFLLTKKPAQKAEVKVTQISGEKISHSGFSFSGSDIKFKSVSEGKGEIETEIPKQLVPEADAWMNKVRSVIFSYGYKFDGDKQVKYFGALYNYRIDRILIGGGADYFTDRSVGVKAAAGFCW